jgi:hypothetical protein
MINHVRTLLANAPANTADGWEYVPADFTPRQLSSTISRIRRFVFGLQPTPTALNYRLRQVMQLLHATELETYVLAKDPRVTYLPFGVEFQNMNLPEDLTVVCSLLTKLMTYDDEQVLFGKYPAFHELWKASDNIAYKFGALMLAVAYGTEGSA